MNFFMVGSFFMLFMLNAGWTSNYVIKLVGFLFFAVGTAEAEERTDAFAHLKKPAYTSSAMCALAVVCQLLLKLLSPAAMAANVISILLSAATVYTFASRPGALISRGFFAPQAKITRS